MQGFDPFGISFSAYPLVARFETDTATPRQQIPIYYIHSLKRPCCPNPLCICQQGREDVTRLLTSAGEGAYVLQEAQQIPVRCQTYGHSWHVTDNPGVKVCPLCGMHGYCPLCTPLVLRNAQPFLCTPHTKDREVQP